MSQPPSPSEPVTIEKNGDVVIARVNRKLLNDSELKLMAQLIDTAADAGGGTSRVLIDLSAVHLIPSLGLGVLVQIANKCRTRQQKLTLAGVQPQVRQVFTITKLDRFFELKNTIDEAME